MYAYITDNNLENRQNYMYSKYDGKRFLREYIEVRRSFLGDCNRIYDKVSVLNETHNAVEYDLAELLRRAVNAKLTKDFKRQVDGYVKSFEVRKWLYAGYVEGTFKPIDEKAYNDSVAYILFAELLVIVYRKTKCLKYFSCLLKLNDTLISLRNILNAKEYCAVCRIITEEMDIYKELFKELVLGTVADGIK